MRTEDVLPKLLALGFSEADAAVLADHFLEAERRGKRGHGFSRVEWLATQEVDPAARPERIVAEEGFERWDGRGAVGYLTLAAICASQVASPPRACPGRRRLALLPHRDARALDSTPGRCAASSLP